MHAHILLMRTDILQSLCCHLLSVFLPTAARKSLKFGLLSCLGVGQLQAIKQFIISLPLFSPSKPGNRFVSGVFSGAFTIS